MCRRTTFATTAAGLGIAALASLAVPAYADCDRGALVGYTIVAQTSVSGAFHGCEHDRVIKYLNGMTTTCDEYSYGYAYEPDATLYAGPVSRIPPTNGYCGGRTIKACIDDELYDMELVLVRCPPREQPETK
jgi:hypothetical protein